VTKTEEASFFHSPLFDSNPVFRRDFGFFSGVVWTDGDHGDKIIIIHWGSKTIGVGESL